MSDVLDDPGMKWEFEAIGTFWNIRLFNVLETERFKDLQARVRARIEEFDRNYSRFRDDSLVREMARAAGAYELPADAKPLFDLYEELYRATRGRFTPLIGQTLVDAGYDANYSLQPTVLTSPPAWEEVLEYTFPLLTLLKPALLDLGAIGKGYLVDIVAALLEDEGIEFYIIDAGGDMRVSMPSGEHARIGLEHPDDTSQVIGVVEMRKGALCGSAGNRRAWADTFHHIIDPIELQSPTEIKAVWVAAPEARLADALTTCFFLVPAVELVPQLAFVGEFEYLIVHADYSFERSEHFPAEIFIA